MSTATEPFIRFEPIYQTRVWGGRTLETRFGRLLPDREAPFGESWEISARDEADSLVEGGRFGGKTLSQLWSDPDSRAAVFGEKAPDADRFPLLCKILDARERLSLQVHPPAEVAAELGGEPKTEVWYVAHAEPNAVIYAGLREGVTEDRFREALEQGTAEECVHAIPTETGDHIFIPSGRLHAIGAGLTIYEIQQNSDTTYRVYDWNRVGLDGKPRRLHVEESLKCIDFDDVEPTMDAPKDALLTECEHFRIEEHGLQPGDDIQTTTAGRFAIVTVVMGAVTSTAVPPEVDTFREGDFFIVPAGADASTLQAEEYVELLLTTWPE
ncbi:MAG: type I phosphomannose isomerase catalytic subunit [Verrucomicrobiales bacterium]